MGFHQVKFDPTMFFSFLFGSDRFEPWIGELYVDLMIKVMARGATFVREFVCVERGEKRF